MRSLAAHRHWLVKTEARASPLQAYGAERKEQQILEGFEQPSCVYFVFTM